jgi:NifB/MoaA-like Fe-S oxidoreductase
VEKWAAHFRARYGVGLAYCTDEYYLVTGRPFPPLAAYDGLALHENGLGMVRAFLDEWEALQKDEVPALQPRYQHLTLVTAALFAPILSQAAATLAAQTGLRVDVLTVLNQRLGAGITVAGLLMGEDVLAVLQNAELGQLIILPRIMFDHPDGVSLDDISPQTLAERLGRPIALADSMGDVLDALHGQNKLTFLPQGSLIPPEKIAQDGGWAVEKYL